MKDSVKKLLKKDGALNAIHSAVVRAYAEVSKEPIWSDKMLADEVLTQLYTQADEAEQAEPEESGDEKLLDPNSIPPKEPEQTDADPDTNGTGGSINPPEESPGDDDTVQQG